MVVVLALLVAGCGGGGDDDGSRPSPSPELNAKLRAAVTANRLDEARELLDQGANPNAADAAGNSAFLLASSEIGPEPAMLELLLENGADVNAKDAAQRSTALIRAAQRGYPELVEPLLEADADLDHVNDLNFTALLASVIFGDGSAPYQEVVRLLVDAGADVTIADVHGTPPRGHAELGGQDEIAAILREEEGVG